MRQFELRIPIRAIKNEKILTSSCQILVRKGVNPYELRDILDDIACDAEQCRYRYVGLAHYETIRDDFLRAFKSKETCEDCYKKAEKTFDEGQATYEYLKERGAKNLGQQLKETANRNFRISILCLLKRIEIVLPSRCGRPSMKKMTASTILKKIIYDGLNLYSLQNVEWESFRKDLNREWKTEFAKKRIEFLLEDLKKKNTKKARASRERYEKWMRVHDPNWDNDYQTLIL